MTQSELYDEFFSWLDDNMPRIEAFNICKELEDFEISVSDLLASSNKLVTSKKGHDYYCDVLFELWYKNKYGEKLL